MSPGTRGFFLLISILVVLSGVCLVSISADKRPSREPVPARHGPRKPVRNASKSAAESDVRARGSVTFNKDLESVVIESSAFGDPTSDGQSEPLPPSLPSALPPSTPPITIDTVAPPSFPALTTTSRPVTQTTTHHGYGFHYKPGSAVYTIPGNLEDGLTIAAKPVVNGHKSQFSTVVRTQPSALPHDNWGSFKASTVSRVVVAPPSTRIPVAENLVSRDVTSGDNEIASGSGPVKDPSSSKNPLNPGKEKFPTASGVGEAFENFKSVSKEPQTSASEKQLSSARQGRQRNFSPTPDIGTRLNGNANGIVGDIRCMNMPRNEVFSATLKLPAGFSEGPVFEDVDPGSHPHCKLRPLPINPQLYKLQISQLEPCGVVSCKQPNGQEWLCVTIRFPLVPGLRLPEDEVIVIKCRPQDRSVAQRKSIDFLSAEVEQRSPPTIYSGGLQEFESEIGLFRRLPGTAPFSKRILPGSSIDLGEDIQLRSIVRSGDGWHHSKLTDVIVSRVPSSTAIGSSSQEDDDVDDDSDLRTPSQSARLVFSDGCRNPKYRLLAPDHPSKDQINPLINNFGFRAFMFQNMRNGDSVKISAKVMACVEAIDCAPVLCGDDRGEGFGRRRRSVDKNTTVEFQVSTLVSTTPTSISKANNKTNDFENEISVRILDRYTDGRPEAAGNNTVQLQSCRVYMLVTAVVGAVLCLLISAVTVFVMIRKCETRHKTRKHHSEAASSSSTSSSMSKANTTTSSQFDVSSSTVSSSLLPAAATHDDMATLVRAATRRRRTLRRRNEGLRGRSVDRGVEQGMTKDDAEFWLNLFQAARSDDRDTDGIVTGHNKKVQRELLRAFVEGTNNKTIYSPPSHVSSDSGYGRIGTSTWSLSRRQSETSLRDLLQEASTNSMAKTLGRNRIPKSVLRAIEQSMWTPESEDFSHDQQMSYDARRCGWTEPRKRREFPTPAPRNVTKIHVGGGGGAFQRPHNRNHSSYSDDELYAEIGNTDSTISKASIVRGEPIMV